MISKECKKDNYSRISLLMPVYYKENSFNFDLAINSILVNQSRIPDEFILICDGPLNSDLNKIIDKYYEAFPEIFKVYRLDKNQGLGRALNYGLTKCSFNLIARADSDDICDNNRLEIQSDFMYTHPEVSIISSYIDEFEEDWKKPCKVKTMPLTHESIVRMAKFRNPINHMSVMFRKDDIISIGSYRNISYVEDYELWVRAIINGKKLANINKILVHARIGNGMIDRRGNRDYIKSWHELSTYMKKNGLINYFEYYRNMLAIYSFIFMSSKSKKIIYEVFLRKGKGK